MYEHFPFWSYLGWAFNAVLELWIIYIWWQNRKRFRLTVLFPAFVIFLLVSDVICLIALKVYPGTFAYWHSYWLSQLGETVLRALLAIQILGKLFEYRVKVLLWSMYLAFCLMAIFALGLPTGITGVTLQMIIVSDLLSRNCSRDCRVLALHLVARCQRVQRALLRTSVFHVLRRRAFSG